jgi:hypothetical protein
MLTDLGFRQLLALHRLDRIAPEGRDLTDLTCHADLSAETFEAIIAWRPEVENRMTGGWIEI